MTLSVSSQPMRVIISGGIAGPSGVGIASATLDANSELQMVLTDGTVLPSLSLAVVIQQAVSAVLSGGRTATLDADGRLTLGGQPVLGMDALGRLVISAPLPTLAPEPGSGVLYSNGGVLCVA